LEAVVQAVGIGPDAVPVTLKIRTGWDREHKNAIDIARLAEKSGISMLTVHGRTRADLYHGEAEYETITAVKNSVAIPVVANGDITTPEKAEFVLKETGADAIMIGRAAQGRPWIFREINHFLETGGKLPTPQINGEYVGLRTARKHIGWYCKGLRDSHAFRQRMNTADDCKTQLQMVNDFFNEMKSHSDRLLFLEAA
jgi:tRNA-dihydrouridine synthase B